MSTFFTVFTASHNRAKLLQRVYDSLETQTFRSFEWIIVDDGSTDRTKEHIEGLQGRSSFPIILYSQSRSGKHVAMNKAVSMASGYLFVTLDSDDVLLPNSLERIKARWEAVSRYGNVSVAGIWGLCSDREGRLVGSKFPQDTLITTPLALKYKFQVTGDKCDAIKTSVRAEFLFPEDTNLYCPLSLVWGRIGRKYRIACVNEVFQVVEYQAGGLSDAGQRKIYSAPKGYQKRYLELLVSDWDELSGLAKVKSMIQYIRSSVNMGLQLKQQHKEIGRRRVLWVLTLPIGYVFSFRDFLLYRIFSKALVN